MVDNQPNFSKQQPDKPHLSAKKPALSDRFLHYQSVVYPSMDANGAVRYLTKKVKYRYTATMMAEMATKMP